MTASFDRHAPHYSRHTWHEAYARRLVAHAGLAPGQCVLDAATGTGLAALCAADAVTARGAVLGVDVSAAMLLQAEAAARQRRLEHVRFMAADAHDLTVLESGSFDAVLCSAGMLYLQPLRALHAWRRLLKPAGVVAFSTMQTGSPPAAALFRSVARARGVVVSDPSEPLGDPEKCAAVLSQSGFDLEQCVPDTLAFPRDNMALAWEANLRSPGHEGVHTMNADELEEMRLEFESQLATALAASAEFVIAHVLYVVGRKPARSPGRDPADSAGRAFSRARNR